MKIHVQILDLNLKHSFMHQFLTAWTNQSRSMWKMDHDHSHAEIEIPERPNIPLGIILGAYGVREVDGEKIYHPCGTCVVDMSKIEMDKTTTILTDLIDASSPKPILGKIHFEITWKPLLMPPKLPASHTTSEKLHNAAEKNLTYIAPWGTRGLPPTAPELQKIHSPYYTSNMGFVLPSGAFMLDLGSDTPSLKSIQSHIDRLLTSMKCYGMTRDKFLFYRDKILKGECDIIVKNALVVLAKTFTMHTNQVMKYVSDIQFNGGNTIGTDRWECPRGFDGIKSFVGDCEDCAKEIMVEIHEWQHMKHDNELVKAVQDILKCYVPIVVQGCVDIGGQPKNHIWAALVPEPTFLYTLGDKSYNRIGPHTERFLPTLLLEGTAETHPLPVSIESLKNMNKKSDELEAHEPIFSNIQQYGVNHNEFYKYVVACMTPRWSDRGTLDYIYINRNMRLNSCTYGVPFSKWIEGKYKMVPASRHSEQCIKLMKHIVSYDKPIPILDYTTRIITSDGEPHYQNMWEQNILYGYRITKRQDRQHMEVCNAVDRLRTHGWKIFGNVIDHGSCYWVEWVVENPKIRPPHMAPLFML